MVKQCMGTRGYIDSADAKELDKKTTCLDPRIYELQTKNRDSFRDLGQFCVVSILFYITYASI
jgi:hypothetical protein